MIYSDSHFAAGFTILFVVQILTAIMGILLENIYKTHPGIWREGLFYTVRLPCLQSFTVSLSLCPLQHFLALPLFFPALPKIITQVYILASETQVEMSMPRFSQTVLNFPVEFVLLTINALTQFLCVRGVNFLTSATSAVAVCMVLNLRKLVSLLLSVWIFGTKLEPAFLLGVVVVFGSVLVYATSGGKKVRSQRPQ